MQCNKTICFDFRFFRILIVHLFCIRQINTRNWPNTGIEIANNKCDITLVVIKMISLVSMQSRLIQVTSILFPAAFVLPTLLVFQLSYLFLLWSNPTVPGANAIFELPCIERPAGLPVTVCLCFCPLVKSIIANYLSRTVFHLDVLCFSRGLLESNRNMLVLLIDRSINFICPFLRLIEWLCAIYICISPPG